MRSGLLVLVISLIGSGAGCDGGSKPTDTMKPGQEKKQVEKLTKKAPQD
ncbi:MAG: hypothetical protein JWO38_1592 [Gemmataceae bacterium]|nr:hypothetical protein [Gemmataceae bacterium]